MDCAAAALEYSASSVSGAASSTMVLPGLKSGIVSLPFADYLAFLETSRYLVYDRGRDALEVTADGERPWLFVYAVAAFVYRTTVSIAIASFIATQYFVFGVLLAAWPVAAHHAVAAQYDMDKPGEWTGTLKNG